MKKVLKIGLLVLFLFCALFFTVKADAAEADLSVAVSYNIVQTSDGAYKAYSITDGSSTAEFDSDKLSEVIEYVGYGASEVKINLTDITTEEQITFSEGKYTLSGRVKFEGEGGIIIDNAEISLINITAEIQKGEIRLKNGYLTIENGFVSSRQAAIKMDYSSSAKLVICSGEISGVSERGAIVVEYGSATVGGGTVKNTLGPAIFSSSTLILSGEPTISGIDCDVYLKSPITLADGNKEFTGECDIKYDREFEKGKTSVIAYKASAENESKIHLFDSLGREQMVKFYENHPKSSEKNFLTAYLPYEIKFSSDTDKIQYKLEGEKIEPPEPTLREGYEFLGWKSEDGQLEIDSTATKDEVFYPLYRLIAPSFSFLSMEFVYTEEGKYLALENLSHPLLSDGIVSYRWFKDGEEVSAFGDKILIKNTSDSGKYKCLFTFSYKSDAVTVETPEVNVTVLKKLIEIPQMPIEEYDGHRHSPKLYPPSTYTVLGEGGIDAGEYPITFTVTDSENYGFYPDGNASITQNFIIKKAENEWIEGPKVQSSYSWEKLNLEAKAKFGEAHFLFSVNEEGPYTDKAPSLTGTYFAKSIVYETENYCGLESSVLEFKIMQDELSSLYVVSDALRREYTAFEAFIPDGLTVCAVYVSGREEMLSISDLTVSYHTASSFLFGDNSVVISYGGKSILYPVEVTKAKYDISSVVFDNCEYEYCGGFVSPSFNSPMPSGADGIPLSYEIIGGGTSVGEYAVELRFYTESKNYFVPDSIFAIMSVCPKKVEIVWEKLSFVYDGKLKIPTAYFTDIHGEKIFLPVSMPRSYAGVYEVTAAFESKNYTADNTTVSFEILRADYDLSEIFWSAEQLVYNGEEQCVTLSGLPLGVSVVGYSDNRATDAGNYTAGVTLSYDIQNYNPPEIMPFEWKILKAEYDLSVMEFSDVEAVYDGRVHFPLFSGDIPTGLDGSVLSYAFSRGALNVSDGKTLVKISFFTDSKNYNVPAEIYRFVTVLPLEIEVRWDNLSSVYSGREFTPVAVASECDISVTGAQINAGKYTALAKALDSNYAVKNSTCEFEILKAENGWSVIPSVSDMYASKIIHGKGKAEFGSTEYIYSQDKTEITTLPDTHGVFYFKAVSDGDLNHLPISSEWIKFEIIEVVAVDFFVELARRDFLTLHKISEDDLKAFVRNNDSSVKEIPYSEISVYYPAGDCLHISDSEIRFSYLGFYDTEKICVLKRDYDLSGVFWEGLSTVYDGNEKHAVIRGLPEGVEVIDYIGNGPVNAGMYVISTRLKYDGENYNEPILPDVIMTVAKQTVFVPDIQSVDYTSELIFPTVENSELYTYSFSGVKDAGEYKIVFTLLDFENYTFEEDKREIEKSFLVNKIKLTVQISDIEKYLFGKHSEPGYKILSGRVIEGETLKPVYEIGEDSVLAVFEEGNYEIEILPGRVNRYNRLAPEDTKLFIFLSIAVLFGAVAIILIVINRKRILHIYRASVSGEDGFIPTAPVVASPDLTENAEEDVPIEESAIFNETEEYIDDLPTEDIDITAPHTVIDAGYADMAITDSLARNLIRRENEIKTNGTGKQIINVDTLSRSFCAEDRVDINILKNKSLIPYDTGYIKVLARGIIDKPLTVYANDFSLSAVKMIALAGGKSIKVNTASEDSVKFRKRT